MDSVEVYPKITVQNLKGLNERVKFSGASELGEFDILKGLVPSTKGALTRINGIKYLTKTPDGAQIMGICQTFDSRGNIIIETSQNVYLATAEELFSQTPYAPSLSYIAFNEEETMPHAVITHNAAIGSAAGTMANNTNFQQAPLNTIVHQVNADGSAATPFVTLASNQFTLTAGVYRIRGWTVGSAAAVTTKLRARLYNVTGAAAAWALGGNENSNGGTPLVAARNYIMHFGGYLNPLITTTYEIQHRASVGTATSTFGLAENDGLTAELYRFIEILKTA